MSPELSGRPLSVVVLGNSVAALVVPAPADRSQLSYADVLEDRLWAAGVQAQVHLEARWFEVLPRALRDYEARVRNHRPDVVVVQYGFNELSPAVLPRAVVRHFLARKSAVTRSAQAYRRWLAPLLWAPLRGFRRVAMRVLGPRTWTVSPARFGGHLQRLATMVREQRRALVVVLDLPPTTGFLEVHMPGLARRRELMQAEIAATVARIGDPDVRLLPVDSWLPEMQAGGRETAATYDGIHLTPLGHQRLGELLAEVVLEWQSSR